MIIRRRHTANFTTIGNALFEDKRLAADEVGILAWLLSRPHDWEVRRSALMRRWAIGAVSTKRIFNNWLRTGWAQARKTRLQNGTFHIVYEIRDEPGRALTDEEIREALSLVSSEAVDDQSFPEDAANHPHTTDPPPPGHQGVANQGVATAPRPIEDSQNTDLRNTESVVIDSARESLISKAAQQLADDCVVALGCDPIEIPGVPYQAAIWLARGYDPLRIVGAFARFAGDRPIKPLTYFVKVVETACTALAAPSSPNNPRRATPRPGSREDRQEQTANARKQFRERAYGLDADGRDRGDEAGRPIPGRLCLPKPD